MNILENIKVLRLQKRLSQLDVAEALAISQSAYAQLESGKTEITLNRLEQLAKLFGMTVIELLQYGGGVESVKVDDSEKVKELENKVSKLEFEVKKLDKWLDDKDKIIEYQANALTKNELTKNGGILYNEYIKIREQLAKENPQLNVIDSNHEFNGTEMMLRFEKGWQLSRMAFRKVLDNYPVLELALKHNLISEEWILGVWGLMNKETK